MPDYVRVKAKDTGAHLTITQELYDTSQEWETGSPYTLLKGDALTADGNAAPFEYPETSAASTAPASTATKKES